MSTLIGTEKGRPLSGVERFVAAMLVSAAVLAVTAFVTVNFL